jgi:hypothetical protein
MIVERPALERRIQASLDAGRIPVLLGGCGSGRTSALLRTARQIGASHAHYLNLPAAATTPERCLAAIVSTYGPAVGADRLDPPAATARQAFESLLHFLDGAIGPGGTAPTFLIDEFLDVRTFESFPGLRHVQREFVTRLAGSPTRFVLASRFTARMHRLLRDAPPRFEVVHVPPLDVQETTALALHFDGARREWATDIAPAVCSLAGGRAAYVAVLLETLSALGPAIDPVAALASLFAPEGRLTSRCRESYEFRLQRARGYGALKAILGVLAHDEPLSLTEIAIQMRRTPGSTKDYLSWLEDVDLVRSQGKRYSFDDPLLRVYVRLYARPLPPSDADVVREIAAYAKATLVPVREPVAAAVPGSAAASPEPSPDAARSGIIEID